MKKLFTLFALTLVAAITVNASAQSLVGKWDSAAGSSQYAMMEAMGGEIEKTECNWTFSSNKTYATYSYIKSTADVMGVTMYMELEMTESGSWAYNGDKLTITPKDYNVSKFNISFSDPSLNSTGEMIKSTFMDAFETVVGTSVVYDVAFEDNNNVSFVTHNDIMDLEYYLKRVR